MRSGMFWIVICESKEEMKMKLVITLTHLQDSPATLFDHCLHTYRLWCECGVCCCLLIYSNHSL